MTNQKHQEVSPRSAIYLSSKMPLGLFLHSLIVGHEYRVDVCSHETDSRKHPRCHVTALRFDLKQVISAFP